MKNFNTATGSGSNVSDSVWLSKRTTLKWIMLICSSVVNKKFYSISVITFYTHLVLASLRPPTHGSAEQLFSFWSLNKTIHAYLFQVCPIPIRLKESEVKHCLPHFIHVNGPKTCVFKTCVL